MKLGDVCETTSGGTPLRSETEFYEAGTIPWLKSGEVSQGYVFHAEEKITLAGLEQSSAKMFPVNTVLVAMYGATAGQVGLLKIEAATNQAICGILPSDSFIPGFLYLILRSLTTRMVELSGGGGQPNISQRIIRDLRVPLLPIKDQMQFVAELDGYRRIVEGAKQVIANYRPRIPIHADWPDVTFSNAPLQIIDGDRGTNYPKKEDFKTSGYCLFLNTKNVRENGFLFEDVSFISKEKDESLRQGKLKPRDVVLTTRGTVGNTGVFDSKVPFEHIRINSGMLIFRPDESQLDSEYLFIFFQSENFKDQVQIILSGSAQPQLPIRNLQTLHIPIPDIDTQKEIVSHLKSERALVDANQRLIGIYEKKIQDKLAEIWGEEEK